MSNIPVLGIYSFLNIVDFFEKRTLNFRRSMKNTCATFLKCGTPTFLKLYLNQINSKTALFLKYPNDKVSKKLCSTSF